MTAALSVRGLSFAYARGDEPVVRVGMLEVAAGESLLLAGPSGCGKSTLLQLIAGLLTPGSGSVTVAGEDIHRLRGAKRDKFRGRAIGMVFQTHNLLTGFSAAENVMAAAHLAQACPAGEQRERAMAALGRLGIDRPDSPVEQLSVGQQQRVAVARAIVNRPGLILADEPTASLDPERADGAVTLLQEAAAEVGAALVCTSHDPRLGDRFVHRRTLDELAEGV